MHPVNQSIPPLKHHFTKALLPPLPLFTFTIYPFNSLLFSFTFKTPKSYTIIILFMANKICKSKCFFLLLLRRLHLQPRFMRRIRRRTDTRLYSPCHSRLLHYNSHPNVTARLVWCAKFEPVQFLKDLKIVILIIQHLLHCGRRPVWLMTLGHHGRRSKRTLIFNLCRTLWSHSARPFIPPVVELSERDKWHCTRKRSLIGHLPSNTRFAYCAGD